MAVALTCIVLGGGFGILTRKTRLELGEARARVQELERQHEWYVKAITRNADSDPTLDELLRVSERASSSDT